MRIKHKFIDLFFGEIIENNEILCVNDVCIFCSLQIDLDKYEMFQKLIEKYDSSSDENDYNNDLEFCYKCINEEYPCLTEEEYTIKKLLE